MDLSRAPAMTDQEAPGAWLAELPQEGYAPAVWRVRIRMADRPGTLARVAIRLADLECNILGLAVLPVPEGVLDEIVIRPATGLTQAQLVRAIRDEDCECLGVTNADVHELVDSASASLAAAGRVVAEPARAAEAVRDILVADMVTVVPAGEANPGRSEGGHRAVFPLGVDHVLVARRRWAPFVQLELARAESLLRLLGIVRANVAGPAVVTCTDGATVVLRDARAGDADTLYAMHGRCSMDTLYRRYHTGMRTVPRRWLHRLLTPPGGSSVVGVCGREVIALGQLIPAESGESAEISLLIEDAWQRNGLGTALLGRLAVLAAARGCRELIAMCLPQQDGVRRTASRAGLRPRPRPDGDDFLRILL